MGEYIEVGGHMTWVEEFGSTSAAETVVLLHGGISNCDDLRPAASFFEDRYRMIAFDWSDGGIVALLVALRRPDLVRRMVLIGTDFHYEGGPSLWAGSGDGGHVRGDEGGYT